MNFQGNFRPIGEFDISEILDLVSGLTDEEWNDQNVRQKRYEVHRDTQFIPIVYDEDFRHQNGTRWPALNKFGAALRPLFAMIADYYENAPDIMAKFEKPVQGYFIRVNLAKLKAGGEIHEHRDMNFSLAHAHRIHLPIITNDQVWFNIDYQTENLKAGRAVEINNRRAHSVRNEGSEDRVHIILDWVFPWEPCCCSYITHPNEPCTPQNCLMTDRLKIPCNCYPEDAEKDKAAVERYWMAGREPAA